MRHLRQSAFVLCVLTGGCASHTAISRVSPPATSVPPAIQRQVHNAVDAGEGDYEARQLRVRLDADPANTALRLELARHYQAKGFPDIAIEHCRIACERAPESVEAHVALAKVLRDDKRPEEGAAELTRFAAGHGENVEVQAWLGVLRDDTGDWAGAEPAHRKAVSLAPNRDDLHNNLGYCLLQLGKKTEAADEFRAALKINPQSVFARNNLGLALAENTNEAILHWQSVATPADAHSNMAAVLIEQGKYPEARREIALALGYNRQHLPALNNLRLVSELDGRAADIKRFARPRARFAGLRSAWNHFLGRPEPGVGDNGSSTFGTPVASR